MQHQHPPKDDLIRAVYPAETLPPVLELRSDDDSGPTLTGHFAVFNTWTEINSLWEGNFLERIAPGAFKKTFRENRDGMRVLFQHGQDPQIGDKPLGPISELAEDERGAYYEVDLLDAPYVRNDILPGLKAGLYGASFRFRVLKEEFDEEPDASDGNPRGLPERTIKEAQVMEFGPVTFPAYAEATAGVRSLTDDFRLPGLRDLVSALGIDPARAAALEPKEPAPATPDPSRSTRGRKFNTREEWLEWIQGRI